MARKREASIFDEILAQAFRRGLAAKDTKKAAKWFREKSLELGKGVTPAKLMKEDSRLTGAMQYGRMYCYYYDPKHKKTLPYYDRFPLIFPIDKRKGGFLGINLHYLAPPLRGKLMDALMSIANNSNFDKSTKLIVSYQLLNASAKYKWFRPCVKHYLRSHLRSPFLKIEASEWNIALMLPVARFVKASQQEVWSDSMEKI